MVSSDALSILLVFNVRLLCSDILDLLVDDALTSMVSEDVPRLLINMELIGSVYVGRT